MTDEEWNKAVAEAIIANEPGHDGLVYFDYGNVVAHVFFLARGRKYIEQGSLGKVWPRSIWTTKHKPCNRTLNVKPK